MELADPPWVPAYCYHQLRLNVPRLFIERQHRDPAGESTGANLPPRPRDVKRVAEQGDRPGPLRAHDREESHLTQRPDSADVRWYKPPMHEKVVYRSKVAYVHLV